MAVDRMAGSYTLSPIPIAEKRSFRIPAMSLKLQKSGSFPISRTESWITSKSTSTLLRGMYNLDHMYALWDTIRLVIDLFLIAASKNALPAIDIYPREEGDSWSEDGLPKEARTYPGTASDYQRARIHVPEDLMADESVLKGYVAMMETESSPSSRHWSPGRGSWKRPTYRLDIAPGEFATRIRWQRYSHHWCSSSGAFNRPKVLDEWKGHFQQIRQPGLRCFLSAELEVRFLNSMLFDHRSTVTRQKMELRVKDDQRCPFNIAKTLLF
ncbi:hypothetical protein MBM_04522 [Drepanopeziza brunnea f. sp. 'multigermtubi' MB_m1]|uniref:Uncharacterized protein n=1 Tax=Marssonina brunnea f. sp. multigermtubi (strain MB_m1) TaxID=1072389 RepID=K1WH69_MARBU|nr:uncharacterized protein MBM_04522 [Drepanopeziza brunnea f. sp. 'multigermtubi' MB_m1]EKD16945.1 hypothetical protein MBM_04522 [Drepanopeziza brunnea f. sp. 'multigermtubi' MB_m1]